MSSKNSDTTVNSRVRFKIRPLTHEEVLSCLEFQRKLDMDYGFHNSMVMLDSSPGSILGAISDQEDNYGEILGTISIKWGEKFPLIGFFLLNPRYHVQGVVDGLSNKIIQLDNADLMLNYMPGMEPLIHSLKPLSKYANNTASHYSGVIPDYALQRLSDCKYKGIKVKPVKPKTKAKVLLYDKKLFNCSRTIILQALDTKEIIAMAAIGTWGKIHGYGMIQKSIKNGIILGPLYANSEIIAEMLTAAIIREFGDFDKEISITIFKENSSAFNIVNKLELRFKFDIPQYFKEKGVDIPLEKAYVPFDLNFSIF